jgi:hypothetical protein
MFDFQRCSQMVDQGATRVRGFHRMGRCAGSVVFKDAEGKHYCAIHAKGEAGYTPKEKPVKSAFRVFYTKADGQKSQRFVWEAASVRGATMAVKRAEPGCTVDGVFPNMADAEWAASPEAAKWVDWG